MKRAIIVANGRMEKPLPSVLSIKKTDLIIAADGGIHNCIALGLRPEVIIGDLDSMTTDEISAYRSSSVEINPYPSHKDETDLELALQYAVNALAHETIILGALGARWDMTFANVLLIAHPRFSGLNIRLLDGAQEIFLLQGGKRLDLDHRAGDAISLIPLCGDAGGIITHGLEYSLNDENLQFGSPRGVSNTIVAEHSQVFLSAGLLLCILERRSR